MSVDAQGFFENKQVETNSQILFLKTGITRVRILPAYNQAGDWFREIQEIPLYQNGKYSPVVSPASIGAPCPFAQKVRQLQQEGGEANIALAQKFRPRIRVLFNAVVYETPSGPMPIQECVKVVSCGVKVKRQILDINQDKAGGWGDATLLDNGLDLTISRTGTGRTDTEYMVRAFPQRSNVLEYLEKNGFQGPFRPHDLDAMYTPKSFEELQALLQTQIAELTPQQQVLTTPVTVSPGGGVQFQPAGSAPVVPLNETPPAAPVEPATNEAPATPVFPFGNQD